MLVVETVEAFRAALVGVGRPLGLVPTMGALHAGHQALLRAARDECATVAASIFVNPAQFGPSEDLASYPRDRQGDLAMMRKEGVDVVFTPALNEVYPAGFATSVLVGELADRLEGASRPGHFSGVATVVCKLLAIARPDRSYFGQKDAQQLLVIRRLNDDLNLGATVVSVPTVREADGLALSSRNAYLSASERRSALAIIASLRLAGSLRAEGETDGETVRRAMRREIETRGARVDYVSIADPETLEELGTLPRGPALALVAAFVGQTRLIDNLPI